MGVSAPGWYNRAVPAIGSQGPPSGPGWLHEIFWRWPRDRNDIAVAKPARGPHAPALRLTYLDIPLTVLLSMIRLRDG